MRNSIVEGIFYPAQQEKLTELIQNLLDNATAQPAASSAILVPHAGYSYTGALLAEGFKSAMGRDIRTAVVLAPVIRDAQDGIFLSDFESFQTPLGAILVDTEKRTQILQQQGRVSVNNFPFLEEHSIEVQLPFIQTLFPEAKLVPIHVGRQNTGTIKQLAKSLKETFKGELEHTLFVVSANTSPYMQRQLAKEYAENFLSLMQDGDYSALLEALQGKRLLPNGTGCAAAVLGTEERKPEVKVLGTADSGGDKIVCYAALGLQRGK